jgi:hypothetical protein
MDILANLPKDLQIYTIDLYDALLTQQYRCLLKSIPINLIKYYPKHDDNMVFSASIFCDTNNLCWVSFANDTYYPIQHVYNPNDIVPLIPKLKRCFMKHISKEYQSNPSNFKTCKRPEQNIKYIDFEASLRDSFISYEENMQDVENIFHILRSQWFNDNLILQLQHNNELLRLLQESQENLILPQKCI